MTTPEVSRPQRAEAIGKAGIMVEIVATPAECAAVARRLGIPALRSLVGKFQLQALEGGAIAANATVSARLVRDCVVSLEQFETTQREAFSLRFVPEGSETVDPDPESDDEIPFAGGMIDLGEALVEQVALDLDPFPRKPGAVLPEEAAPENVSPFAALAALRGKR